MASATNSKAFLGEGWAFPIGVDTAGEIAVAIYEGPPPETKDKLNFRLPRMAVLNCRSGLVESELDRFIKSLQAEGGA